MSILTSRVVVHLPLRMTLRAFPLEAITPVCYVFTGVALILVVLGHGLASLAWGLLGGVLFSLGLLVHEAGHVITAYRHVEEPITIELGALDASMRFDVEEDRLIEIPWTLIHLSGPIAGLVYSGFCLAAGFAVSGPAAELTLNMVGWISAGVNVRNLIGSSVDGGLAWKAWRSRQAYVESIMRARADKQECKE